MKWTHSDLVERSAAWLRSTKRCKCVLAGSAQWDSEQPDAIGWLPTGESIVIESKTTKSDWYADKRKAWRYSNTGMGVWRYYLMPDGLLDAKEYALYRESHVWLAGCGLLVARGRRILDAVQAEPRQLRNWAAEIRLLLAVLVGNTGAGRCTP